MMMRSASVALALVLSGCDVGGCSKYSSDYSCGFVEDEAEYEVWYWRNLQADEPSDETLIGRAVGLRMCEGNAQAFASAIGEPFDEQAYICVLMDGGKRMEKHRLLDYAG